MGLQAAGAAAELIRAVIDLDVAPALGERAQRRTKSSN